MPNQEKRALNHINQCLKQLIDQEVEADYQPAPLQTLDQLKQQLYLQNRQALDEYLQRLKRGMQHLKDAGLLDHILDKKLLQSLLRKIDIKQRQPALLQKELKLTSETVLLFYRYGKDVYQKRHHEEAADVFLFLTALNPLVAPFWVSLGVAEEVNQRFDAAIMAYLMALDLDLENLTPALSVARCFQALHKPEQARVVLHEAIEQADNEAKHQEFKERALQLLKKL